MGQHIKFKRILIVDDNRDSADLLAQIFALHGHSTCVAYGGQQGLSSTIHFDPDIVFLDLGMPDLSGYEVASRLRGMPELRQPLLIAFTAWNDARVKAQISTAGFDLHIPKTVGVDVLLDAVHHASS